jgi:hypothetical protein
MKDLAFNARRYRIDAVAMGSNGISNTVRWGTEAPAAGCLNHDDVPRGKLNLIRASERYDGSVSAFHPLAAYLSRFATGQTERRDSTT